MDAHLPPDPQVAPAAPTETRWPRTAQRIVFLDPEPDSKWTVHVPNQVLIDGKRPPDFGSEVTVTSGLGQVTAVQFTTLARHVTVRRLDGGGHHVTYGEHDLLCARDGVAVAGKDMPVDDLVEYLPAHPDATVGITAYFKEVLFTN